MNKNCTLIVALPVAGVLTWLFFLSVSGIRSNNTSKVVQDELAHAIEHGELSAVETALADLAMFPLCKFRDDCPDVIVAVRSALVARTDLTKINLGVMFRVLDLNSDVFSRTLEKFPIDEKEYLIYKDGLVFIKFKPIQDGLFDTIGSANSLKEFRILMSSD